jgi:hypothetical protein
MAAVVVVVVVVVVVKNVSCGYIWSQPLVV